MPIADPANIAEMLELSTSVQYVKGIGPRLAEVLAPRTSTPSTICSIICPFATKIA